MFHEIHVHELYILTEEDGIAVNAELYNTVGLTLLIKISRYVIFTVAKNMKDIYLHHIKEC